MMNAFDFSVRIGNCPCSIIGAGFQHGLDDVDNTFQQHNHACFEIHYVRRGSCSILAAGHLYEITAGYAILLPPGTYHHIAELTEDVEKLDISFTVGDDASASSFEPEPEGVRSAFSVSGCIIFFLQDSRYRALLASLDYLSDIFINKEEQMFLGREQFRAMSGVFLVELYSILSKTPSDAPRYKNDIAYSRICTLDSFFAHNYKDPDPCRLLAEMLNVSQRQVSRLVRQQYNMSFREKINETRLQNAIALLTNSDTGIADIAEQMGYGSPSNFSSFIRSQTGLSPSQIRNRKEPLTGKEPLK